MSPVFALTMRIGICESLRTCLTTSIPDMFGIMMSRIINAVSGLVANLVMASFPLKA